PPTLCGPYPRRLRITTGRSVGLCFAIRPWLAERAALSPPLLLLNQVVRERQQCVRHDEVYCPRTFQVDYKQVPGRLFDRKSSRGCTVEQARDKRRGAIKGFALISAIGHQAAFASDKVGL